MARNSAHRLLSRLLTVDSPGLVRVLAESQRLGFLGPGPIEAQIAHARAFATAFADLPAESHRLDLGAGGGLPGLVLATDSPSGVWVFLDASERRSEFLEAAVQGIEGLGEIEIVRQRAEEAARHHAFRARFDLVVARSFGPPAVTAECAAGFLDVGGRLVVSEPPEEAGDRWPVAPLAELGFGAPRYLEGPPRLVVLTLEQPCPERFPRRVGIPAKRPLFGST